MNAAEYLVRERAICVQQMNECAAAIRVSKNPEQQFRMKIRLLDLVTLAHNHGWLPECFSIDPELQV